MNYKFFDLAINYSNKKQILYYNIIDYNIIYILKVKKHGIKV